MIRTYDGRRIVIPNSELFTNSVTVNTAFESRRLEYDVGIGYGDDIDEAKRLILEAIHETEEVLQKPAPDSIVVDLAESTVNIRARWWVHPPLRAEELALQDKVLGIEKAFLVMPTSSNPRLQDMSSGYAKSCIFSHVGGLKSQDDVLLRNSHCS